MEHSLLHGVQLCGIIFALGGILFRILVFKPALRDLDSEAHRTVQDLEIQVESWIFRSALGAALATTLDFFVQVAELDGQTIYGGVDLSILFRYLTTTAVGKTALIRAVAMYAVAYAVRARLSDTASLLFLGAAAVAATMVSHSAALPAGRGFAVASQLMHIFGAAFWLGMLGFLHLVTVKSGDSKTGRMELIGRLTARYSPYALLSVVAITASGLYSAFRFIVSPRAIFLSAYGLTLILKIVLLFFAVYAGFLNWRLIRPRLTAGQKAEQSSLLRSFLRLTELELTAGVLLMLVAGVLGAISPPGEIGTAQLTADQAKTLAIPRLPPKHFVDPASFVGSNSRTDNDLRYAEFTHQWSGVFVILLGLAWLGQSVASRFRSAFARAWAWLLIPFGLLISAIADPEVWILRTYSLREVLSNPQVLEHQIGAAIVFVLASLGLADRKREQKLQPLGYMLPLIILAGSLMLLGHAHSNIGVTEELSSLVNMEHAIIGGLGLLAGVCRWLQIRDLPGAVSYRWLWPSLIVATGVFMAFFYRELIPTEPTTLAIR